MRTTVQFGGTQTDLYSGVAEDSSTLVPPASKLILDASGVPVVPFSPGDPGIAAVDWISVDENGYLVAQAADIALLAELHEEARTSDLLQVKSPTTKPTKPSRPSGTRSRIKNAANTPTAPNSSPALSTPALRPLTYPPRSP